MTEQYNVWDDGKGNSIIIKADFPREIYVRLQEKTFNGGNPDCFYTLRVGSGSFCGDKVKATLDNPHNPMSGLNGYTYKNDGKIYQNGDSLCLALEHGDAHIFHGKRTIDSLPDELIVPLPEIRVKDYLISDGNVFIYFSRDNYQWDPIRFFMGAWDEMDEYEVINFERFRDGGTTNIKTGVGNLHVPTPWNRKENQKTIEFDGEKRKLMMMDCPKEWEVSENNEVAAIDSKFENEVKQFMYFYGK